MGEWLPDVVLLDVGLPGGQGLARELAQNVPAIPVVALGVDGSEAEIVACAEAGMTGYLTREASLEELVDVVGTAARGEVICSPRLAGAIVRRLATLAARNRGTESTEPVPRLTRREREILGFLERDLTNKEIASQLSIEVATVKNHVHNVLDKLSVRRRGEAARLVSRARRDIG
jgi:DNA-binding NarL/FixJ family response regulator